MVWISKKTTYCLVKKLIALSSLLSFVLHSLAIEAIVFDGTGKPAEEKILALTLAGIVNRDAPRLYLRNVYETWSYSETDETWEELYSTQGSVSFTEIYDINTLVQTFKPFLKGAITYDASLTYGNFSGQSFRWQAEAAAMLGGLTDCIPVPSSDAWIDISRPEMIDVPDKFNGQPTIQVSAQLHLSSHPWNNTSLNQEKRYFNWLDWALNNLLSRTNPSKFYLREITDWAVNQRMFQLNLAGTEDLRFTSLSDEKAAKIERVINYVKAKHPDRIFHVYGWMRPEPLVQWISAYGGSFHETLLCNLSWHHVFPVDKNFRYQRASATEPDAIRLKDKYYVLFITSEGDAGNWVFGFQGGGWQSAGRGQVPLGWGINLQMFEEFPFVAQHYFRSASANDGFTAVSTPLGYAYPDVFPDSYLADAQAKTRALMDKFNVKTVYAYKHYNGAGKSTYRGIEISNNFDFYRLGTFARQTNSEVTLLYDPALLTQTAYTNYEGLLYNHVTDQTFYADVSNPAIVVSRIVSKLMAKSKPGFLLAGYQRMRQDNAEIGAGSHDLTIPRLKGIMDGIKADASVGNDVEFVTPEVFSVLLRKSLGLVSARPFAVNDLNNLSVGRDPDNNLQLSLQVQVPEPVEVKIYDLAGRLVYKEFWKLFDNRDVKTIQMTRRGLFVIHITGQHISLKEKVLL